MIVSDNPLEAFGRVHDLMSTLVTGESPLTEHEFDIAFHLLRCIAQMLPIFWYHNLKTFNQLVRKTLWMMPNLPWQVTLQVTAWWVTGNIILPSLWQKYNCFLSVLLTEGAITHSGLGGLLDRTGGLCHYIKLNQIGCMSSTVTIH